MRIGIIKVGAMGDVVRTTSILAGLRRRYTDAQIVWATDISAKPLLDGLYNAEIVDAASVEWQTRNYDWLINLEDDKHWCYVANRIKKDKVSGAIWAGMPPQCRYTHDLHEWFGMGLLSVEREDANRKKRENKRSFNQIMFDGLDLGEPLPPTIVPPLLDQWKEDYGGKIGINTGAGGRWAYKKWGEHQTAELICRLWDHGLSPVLLGGSAELERNGRIANMCNGKAHIAPHDLSLSEFAAIIGNLKLLITSDSLAMHLAISQKVNSIAFFGPTSSAEIDLFGCGTKITTPLPCRACYLSTCDVRPHCMDSITVDMMWSEVLRYI